MNLSNAAILDAAALALDAAEVDSWVGAHLDTDGPVLTRESGARDRPIVTTVGDGIIRVRIGAPVSTSMLVEFEEQEVSWAASGDRIVGVGAEIAFDSDGGLRLGPLVRSRGDGSMGGPGLIPGAVTRDGVISGWVERFALHPYTGVFGGGESVQGPELRGRSRWMRNVETSGFTGYDLGYLNVPLLWSPDGWGLFVHSGAALRADIGRTVSDVLSLAAEGEGLDLFLLTGTPAEILANYHRLTGRPGTMPEWALGTWMSRCSYFSETEIHRMLDEAEAADCPIDVVHVDAWQTGEVLVDLACNWEVDRARFPEGWIARLGERGVRVSLWHNSYVPAASAAAREARELGLFATMPDGSIAESADIAGRLLLDMTNPATIRWWQGKVRMLLDEGAHSIKTDFGEEVPEAAIFFDGRTGSQLRNEYAQLYQEATARAAATVLGQEQPFPMFVRSGTAGSQRTPCHWVGDSAATWAGMTAALRSALSLSMSGFTWVSHDVGGFWVAGSDAHMRASHDGDPSHYTADVDPELFVRWTQWGIFSPVLRFHGAGRREPFAYPDPYAGVAVEATRVRARLRDYLVRSADRCADSGRPMMAPMALAFPQRPELHGLLQYFLGEDVLVAPVLDAGGTARFWLPEGRWHTVLGGAEFGGGWHSRSFPLDDFPAFVRCDPPGERCRVLPGICGPGEC